MLNKAVLDALNEQIKHEYFSSYLYLAMSAHCEAANMPGFARWLRIQSQEEMSHALKVFDYINDHGAKVILQPIDRPPAEYKSPLELFKMVLEHEKKITGLIHKLYELALREGDYATQILLQWFVKEQVEEEKNASAIVEQLKLVGDAPPALIMMDRQLGARSA
jgi:ferritin